MRASASARWIGLSQGARVVSQLAGIAVLGRLLRPEDFGTMAMASIAITFANLLRDMGSGAALIQKDELTDRTVNTVFWGNCALGLFMGLLCVAVSPLVAAEFRTPQLEHVLWAIAPSFPLASVTIAQQGLLERASGFRSVARIEIVSSSVALVAALVAAALGAGVYSLVLQSVLGTILYSIQMWLVSTWRPRWLFSWGELRGLFRFSGNLTAFNVLNFFSRNADNMIVGRVMGSAALGTYSLAYRLMLFPLQNLTFVATRALFPVMSRQQARLDEMSALYLRTVTVIATVTAPLMAGLFMVRYGMVRLVFGPQWADVPALLTWLAPTGFLQSLLSTTGSVLMAKGRTDLLLRLGLFTMPIQLAAFLIGVRFSVVAVAKYYFVANLIIVGPCFLVVLHVLGTPVWRLLRAITPALLGALAMCAVIAGMRRVAAVSPAHWREELAATVAVGALAYAAFIRVTARDSLRDLMVLAGRRR